MKCTNFDALTSKPSTKFLTKIFSSMSKLASNPPLANLLHSAVPKHKRKAKNKVKHADKIQGTF